MEFLQTTDGWFLLGALVSFLFIVYYFFKGRELSRHGIRVEGTVTDYWTEEDAGDVEDTGTTTSYYLKAFFTDEEKFTHSVQLTVSRKVYKLSIKSMSIELVYPDGSPLKAKSSRVSEIYSGAIIWGVILLVIIGCFFLL